jgi:hypothetical protein
MSTLKDFYNNPNIEDEEEDEEEDSDFVPEGNIIIGKTCNYSKNN